MNRKVLVGAALVASTALLLWANVQKLKGEPALGAEAARIQGPSSAPLVKVETIKKRGLTQEVLAPGSVEASGVRELRAPFSSERMRLLVGMGDRLKAGQVVAELEAAELAARVLAQEAQVARAESALVSLRVQQEQAPVQLAQRLEQARTQLIQAEDGLTAISRQNVTLKQRLEQARAGLELLSSRAGSAQVDATRTALVEAEVSYRADPMKPGAAQAYEQARTAYDSALQQSQEAARQAAADLGRAYDELEAAREEYARAGEENPMAVQLAKSQVESARLAVRLAEMEAESGGSIAAQVRAAESDLAAARANLVALKEKLDQASLRAPAGGTVLAVGLKDGQPVQEGQILLTVGDLGQMTVSARVDEVDIGKVEPGQRLSVRSNAYPQNRFKGEVVRAAAQIAQSGGAVGGFFEVEGQVTNPDGLLRSGMNAEVTITAESREDVIVLSLAAVREEGETASVLVVEGFQVKLRPVSLGLRTQTEVEIRAGLTEGEQVIVSPFTLINSLKEGDAVRVEEGGGSAP